VNAILAHHRESAVGIDDLTRFRARATMDVLRTRSLVMLAGVAREHPVCVRPAS
jgi:hypothetical protein